MTSTLISRLNGLLFALWPLYGRTVRSRRASLPGIKKTNWTEMPESFFEPLRFGELEIGERFIFFPSSGDNRSQKGFKIAHRIFTKTQHLKGVETAAGMPFGKATDGRGNVFIFVHSMPIILLAE